MMDQIRSDLKADAWALARSLGVGAKHRKRVALHAEFILANVMTAGESLLEGRFTDPKMVARELACVTEATIKDLIARCHTS